MHQGRSVNHGGYRTLDKTFCHKAANAQKGIKREAPSFVFFVFLCGKKIEHLGEHALSGSVIAIPQNAPECFPGRTEKFTLGAC
jgi:hypothetical protein